MALKPQMGEIEIEAEGQTIKLPVRTELLLQNLMGEISESQLMETALNEAPEWLEMKASQDDPDYTIRGIGSPLEVYRRMHNDKPLPMPESLKPVVAKIQGFNDLGVSTWWEVVYYDGDTQKWRSYSSSTTFDDGEQVLGWIYPPDF